MTNKQTENLNIVVVGHVDHGKSTLIGRLLFETDSLPLAKKAEIEQASKKRGVEVEWSFVLDAFQAERDQAITIDTSRIWFKTPSRECMIIDAPGHKAFLKNMISGATHADAAILVVDAMEGMQEQTRRHASLLKILGVDNVVVAVNKMDAIDFGEARFKDLEHDVLEYLSSLDIEPRFVVPLSARTGDMLVSRGNSMAWYTGQTLIDCLDYLPVEDACFNAEALLRFPVQDVYRVNDGDRVIVGRIEQGSLSVGDTILFSPTHEIAKVKSLEAWPNNDVSTMRAKAGSCVGITLDQPIFVERGHVASHEKEAPFLTTIFRVNLFWVSKKPLREGGTYTIQYGTRGQTVMVRQIEHLIDTQNLNQDMTAESVPQNSVAQIILRTHAPIPLDMHQYIVIFDGEGIVGGGRVNLDGFKNQRFLEAPKSKNISVVNHLLPVELRAVKNGHKGSVFWFTGLSGSGKSTLAMQVERALFDKGYQVYVLDGDNIRTGLNADLGFSDQDRSENIRRVGEVAALMADAGMIVITAFISPFQSDRDRARLTIPDNFHEVHIAAGLSVCEERDPKGLYQKARAGEIQDFTGISSPYEAPLNPEVCVETGDLSVEDCVQSLLSYIESNVKIEEAKEYHVKSL